MRKVKQIAANDGELFALCEDGTLWRRAATAMDTGIKWEWRKLQDLPDVPNTFPAITDYEESPYKNCKVCEANNKTYHVPDWEESPYQGPDSNYWISHIPDAPLVSK